MRLLLTFALFALLLSALLSIVISVMVSGVISGTSVRFTGAQIIFFSGATVAARLS